MIGAACITVSVAMGLSVFLGGPMPRDDSTARDETRRRRAADDVDQLIALLEATSHGVRAGESTTAALHDATQRVHGSRALSRRAADKNSSNRLLVVHAIGLAQRVGGAARSIDQAAHSLRQRRAIALERTAQAAQATFSARVLTIVPLVFAGIAFVTSTNTRHVLTTQPVAIVSALVGLALNAVGWLWMRRIIRRQK